MGSASLDHTLAGLAYYRPRYSGDEALTAVSEPMGLPSALCAEPGKNHGGKQTAIRAKTWMHGIGVFLSGSMHFLLRTAAGDGESIGEGRKRGVCGWP